MCFHLVKVDKGDGFSPAGLVRRGGAPQAFLRNLPASTHRRKEVDLDAERTPHLNPHGSVPGDGNEHASSCCPQ